MSAVYRVSDQRVESTGCAAGPWDPTTQHGAAPAALVAFAAERVATPSPMRVARLTLNLLRPVPVAPLELRSEVVRQGRKVQVISISVLAAGVEVVRASVLKTLRSDAEPPNDLGAVRLDVPSPELSHEITSGPRVRCPFLDGVSTRLTSGAERRPGPTAMWFRADRPIVEGEAISPTMRAAIAADFCNGVSSTLDMAKWSFINADATLNLARPPVGEWVLVNAETWLGGDGGGMAFARLADTAGYFGRATQSLLIERR
jgi:Thioesterase-like superfamily